MLRKLLWLLFGGVVATAGCGAPNAMPREMVQVVDRVTAIVEQQGVLSGFTSDVHGQVINPGIKVYAGILYVAGTNLEGVSGQVGLRSEGTGSGEVNKVAVEDKSHIPSAMDEVKKAVDIVKELKAEKN